MTFDATSRAMSATDSHDATNLAASESTDAGVSHILIVSLDFFIDHAQRFGVKAPRLLGVVAGRAYLSADDRRLTAFAEDAAFYAKQPTGVSGNLALGARITIHAIEEHERARQAIAA